MLSFNNKKGRLLLFSTSIIFNIILCFLIVYIGYAKTNFFKRVGARLNICHIEDKDRPDYWCIQGWNNTIEKLNLNVDIVFFGNSITRGSSFHNYFKDKSVCNLGYPGDTLDGMLLRVKQIKDLHPKKVFIMAGINGLHWQSQDVFKEKYTKLLSLTTNAVPNSEIYLQSILPVNHKMKPGVASSNKIIEANKIIEELAKDYHCTYIDLYSIYAKDGEMPIELTRDGVHLFPESYEIWAKKIQPFIEQ